MKIAYFLDIPKGLGGAGNLLLQQAVLMSEIHDVMVVIPSDKEGNYNIEYANRCEKYQVPYTYIAYKTAYAFSLIDFTAAMKCVYEIEKFAVKEQIDFFHSVQLNIAVEYVSRKMDIPHLMDIYQLEKEEFKLCLEDIYPHYHLCDSLLYSNRWSRELGIESRCIRPVALLDKIRRKDSYIQKKIKILMLGSLCKRKNQLTAIKAIEKCSHYCEIELHIAGEFDNNYSKECFQYVEEHDLKERIFFHGFVSDVECLLENSDCLLCSSVDESFPSSIVEAVTYDLTIISTPVAGVPELFINKKNSFISQDFTYQSISKCILECREFYKNEKIRDIHSNAEKTWLDNFDRKMVRKQIDKYYQDIMINRNEIDLLPFLKMEKLVSPINYLLKGVNDMGEKWIYEKDLYYTVIKKNLDGKKLYIWGAGTRGKVAYEIIRRICPQAQVLAFIDTYKEGSYLNIPIVKFESVSINIDYIYCISFAFGASVVIEYLTDKGLQMNKQIWKIP